MSRSVVVVGDVVLDHDVEGAVSRVCPDAPAVVVDVVSDTWRPGGAGLAATLLAADGCDVVLVAALGADDDGARAARLLEQAGVQLVSLPSESPTRVKSRVRSAGQSLARLDRGSSCPPSYVSAPVVDLIASAQGLLVSDYAGGLLAAPEIRDAIGDVVASHRPVVWDPHVRGTAPPPNIALATPSEQETLSLAARGATRDGRRLGVVAAAADHLVHTWGASAVSATLGADGAMLSFGDGLPRMFPVPGRSAGDPCGAGDRFAATALRVLVEGGFTSDAVERAVVEASGYVARQDTAAVEVPRQDVGTTDAWELVARVRADGGTVVATGGCFDLLHAGHVEMLAAARGLGDCLIVCLNSDESVRRIKGPDRPVVDVLDRARVLSALECVDAVVVFDDDTPAGIITRLRPDIWVKGGDYAIDDLPEAELLERWGGQAVVLPYLPGRSTTALIRTASGSGHRKGDAT